MKACVLASGSKGNATYIATTTTHLLIDLGISCLNVERKLEEINVDPKQIEGILITHTHVDHINGLRVFIKKFNPIIYLTTSMYEELNQLFEIKKYQLIDEDITIGDIKVNVIKTSHDVDDSNGYVLSNNQSSIVYITDTGYLNKKYHNQMFNKNLYIMESNHDIDMLMNGSYPYAIKQRILGDKGHLSNKDCAYYLKKLIGNNTTTIVLAHLSEENNTEQLAYETVSKKVGSNVDKIIIAKQKERTELIEI